MIDVLKRLAELDQGNPNVVNPMTKPVEVQPEVIAEGREVQLNLPEPGLDDLRKLSGRKTLTESAIAECGMPTMGAPMPSMPASINMSAGSANEIVSMVRGIMDLAKGDVPSQSMMPTMGADMPSLLPGFGGAGEPDLDLDTNVDTLNKAQGDVDDDGDHDMGDHAAEPGMGSDDEIMDLIKKIRTGDPVKIKTDMPVKVTSDEPIKGRTDKQANVDSDNKPEDEGMLGTMAGAGIGAALGGPLGAAVGGAAGDSITGDNEEESAEVPGKASTTPNDPTDPGRYDPKKGVFVPNTPGQGDRMDGVMPKGNPEKKDESSNPLAAFESKLMHEYRKFVEEGFPAWAKGREKYGDGMNDLADAAKKGASEKKMQSIRDKHDKYAKKK